METSSLGDDDLVFWAQALDNRSRDICVRRIDGNWEEVEDQRERQELVGEFSAIRRKPEKRISPAGAERVQVHFEGEVADFPARESFVIRFRAEVDDVAGRIANFICFGRAEWDDADAWVDRVLSAVREFGSEYGREPRADVGEIRSSLLSVVEKKTALVQARITIAVGAAAVVAGAGVLWWMTRG